jgi:Glycosyl hydrolase family 99
LPKVFLCLFMACFAVAKACDSPVVSHALPPHNPAPMPTLLAVYMPWFGDHTHMDVGYSSHDPKVLGKQIEQARGMGITAFVVDWYGDSAPYSDANFALLEKVASKKHFQVALLYNEPEDEDQQATDEAIAGLDKAYKSYIGPEAKYHDAYFTYQSHPVIFIFPKQGHVDWNHVRDHCSTWAATPLFIYKDEPPAQYAADFAGSYAWVQPGATGWSPDGSNWGEQYLDYFYKTMRTKHPDKIAIGGVWPGFDDSGAKWGLNRHMQRACGKTFDQTLHMYDRYYDSTTPLPFLLIETWNDYEEGTAVERGIPGSGCGPDQKVDSNPLAAH